MRESRDIHIGRMEPYLEYKLDLILQTLDVETHATIPPELFRKALQAAANEVTKTLIEGLNENGASQPEDKQ